MAQIARFLPNVRLAVDGGAHCGKWTAALLAKQPQAFVHMIEPASEAQAALHRRFSRCQRVKIHKWAASDCEGSAELFSDRAASSLASLIRRDGEALGSHFAHRGISSFTTLPLYLGLVLGSLLLGVVALYLVYALLAHMVWGAPFERGWLSLIISQFLIGGLLFLCVGTVGVYVVHLFDEAKARPEYFIFRETRVSKYGGES